MAEPNNINALMIPPETFGPDDLEHLRREEILG